MSPTVTSPISSAENAETLKSRTSAVAFRLREEPITEISPTVRSPSETPAPTKTASKSTDASSSTVRLIFPTVILPRVSSVPL